MNTKYHYLFRLLFFIFFLCNYIVISFSQNTNSQNIVDSLELLLSDETVAFIKGKGELEIFVLK